MPEIEGQAIKPAGGIAPARLARDNASFGQGRAFEPGELYERGRIALCQMARWEDAISMPAWNGILGCSRSSVVSPKARRSTLASIPNS